MPRYFFDMHDGVELRDEVGRELGDVEEARTEALKVITGLASAEGKDSDGYTVVLDVRNEQARTPSLFGWCVRWMIGRSLV